MFGIGGTEIIVILIVALIAVGPDRLPEAARSISKGIRDLKRSTRDIQATIENDEHIGGAIRDIKSALRGEDPPARPRPVDAAAAMASTEIGGQLDEGSADASAIDEPATQTPENASVRMPDVAGEVAAHHNGDQNDDLAALIKPAVGTSPRQAAAIKPPVYFDEEEDG
jgi:sec-independent protein translocase protein TatB